MRPIQEPTVKQNGGVLGGSVSSHPAYGQITASRVQGGIVLYGSDFVHQHYVTIRIRRSELNRDLTRDWPFARDEIVEVALSEAQWATFVSSLNVGEGTQCTLQYVGREMMPGLPLRQEITETQRELGERLGALAAKVDATIADVDGEIGTGLPKSRKAKIIDRLKALRQEIASNLPFVANSFDKHMEKTVERAKVEVNAYVTSTVQRAGLEALGSKALLQLGDGE